MDDAMVTNMDDAMVTNMDDAMVTNMDDAMVTEVFLLENPKEKKTQTLNLHQIFWKWRKIFLLAKLFMSGPVLFLAGSRAIGYRLTLSTFLQI
uniref:Transmembrane protein n=1 Tax=Marseillevirus LCMAC101 TaxID=2506602 RepID=A0A481YS73_9VIRU|nr:MAG: hypothetical protein LCMAC101_06530 [Marseillevirus LCMAC101]